MYHAELLGGPDPQPQQQSPTALPEPAPAPGGGMFDGLSLARAQSSGAGHPAASVAQQSQPPPPQQGADSLFGGLALAGSYSVSPSVPRCSCNPSCCLSDSKDCSPFSR